MLVILIKVCLCLLMSKFDIRGIMGQFFVMLGGLNLSLGELLGSLLGLRNGMEQGLVLLQGQW